MSTQLNILDAIDAIAARDAGIALAMDNAERVAPGWKEDAFQMFVAWLSGWPSGYKFLIEDFRQVAQIRGLPDPPSARAFGGLAVRAKNKGIIKSAGFSQVRNPKAHMANVSVWQKV